MNDAADDLDQLAGEYVLGTLPHAQRADVARRLPDEPALRAAVDAWERRLLPLTELAAPRQPSAQLWPRIAATLAPRTQAPPTVQSPALWRQWWNSLQLWRALAGGGFAAAAVSGIMLVGGSGVPGTGAAPAFMVVLVGPQDKAPGWVVQASLDRQLTLTPLQAGQAPAHKAFQFWTKGADWKGPVSLGLVAPGKSLKMALDNLPALQNDQLFEITLEEETGSPTGKPSGPVLYIGKAVKVM